MSTIAFDHLLAMSTPIGTFEHADHTTPRREHGYCTDDMARVLVVACREPTPDRAVRDLARTALRFMADAQGPTGKIRNRRNADGRWLDQHGVDDCWGRSLWGFGTAVCSAPTDAMRQAALAYFDHSARQRSPWARAMAFGALGAAEVLVALPHHNLAKLVLVDAVDRIGRPSEDPEWAWPEPRLTYANAALAEALIACGHHLERSDVLHDGLTMLRWLLDRETNGDHLSPTPVGGARRGDPRPRFDQQPIEVAAMADACQRAAAVTGDASWLEGLLLAIGWFGGANDVGTPMHDITSGGGYDGLEASGPNLNEGAESTLALISTLQHAARLVPAPT